MVKMKNFFIANLLFAFSYSLPAVGQSDPKGAAYNYYPDSIKTIDESNWWVARSLIDSTLLYKSESDLYVAPIGIYAWYVLARLADINWSNAKQEEVSKYLTGYALQALKSKDALNSKEVSNPFTDKNFLLYRPFFLPYKAIWAALKINERRAATILAEIWPSFENSTVVNQSTSLSFLLWTVQGAYDRSDVFQFVTNAIDKLNKDLNQSQINLLYNFSTKHELFLLNNEIDSWDLLWQKENIIYNNIYHLQSSWIRNIQIMKEVYKELNVEKVLNIADSSKIIEKKYVFLYSASFIANSKRGTDWFKDNSSSVQRLIKTIEIFYNTYAKNEDFKAYRFKSGDFLMPAFNQLKKHLTEVYRK